MTRGCGLDGGLAEFLVVPRAELISIGGQDPVYFAPLTDAGVTAYHAIQTVVHRLRPGTSAAVIGVGVSELSVFSSSSFFPRLASSL